MMASRRVMRWNGDLMNSADPGGRQNVLHRIECLALQCIKRRPMRLLRGEEVTASGGQRIGPPVPGGDEQQNGDEDRVRRKEEGDLAVGKTSAPRRFASPDNSRHAVARIRNTVRRENPGCSSGRVPAWNAGPPFAFACRIASIIRAMRSAPLSWCHRV